MMTLRTTGAETKGRLIGLYLAVASGEPMRPVKQARALVGRGLEGCRHGKKRPDSKRQVLLMDAANLRALGIGPSRMKENLLVEGLDLEHLPPGQRLKVGDAVLELTEPCIPCHKMDKLRPGLLRESYGRRGVLARVIEEGELSEGAEVTLLDVNPDAPKPIQPRLP